MGRVYLNSITATALLLIFVAVFPQRVKSSSIFELDLLSFSNLDGREISGGCCSGLPGADGSCPGNCSVFLHFCVTHYQATVNVNSDCTFFEFQTPLLSKDYSSSPDAAAAAPELYNVQGQEKMFQNFTFAWPGQFTLIIEAWHPAERPDGSKTLVERFTAQKTLDVNNEWTIAPLLTNRSSIRIKYRVVCNNFYFGPQCKTLCRDRDDTFGHYRCNNDGQIVCLPGWGNSSSYCTKALCEPACEHGWCSDVPNVCKCHSGWMGPTCDTCKTNPSCVHGRCETDPRECLCNEGWGGLMCATDLNFCTNHKPCKNGGTCTNTGVGLYLCSCSDDFMGEHCEIYKDPCMLNPCENGATCINPSAGQYNCTCLPGFFGHRCDTTAVICKENLCLNGGSCIHDPNGFKCSCPMGFAGELCEKVVSTNCQIYPCLNGGTCVNSSNNFRCICPRGITGSRCENADHCSFDSCENGGTCIERSRNITCFCPLGYSGTHCQINDNECSSNPCANGATCVNLLDGYHCDCAPGFLGQYCNFFDYCSSSPCLNGAMCHVTGNNFTCSCLSGYHGERCNLTHSLVVKDLNGGPSVASDVSHRISDDKESFDRIRMIIIITVSVAFVFLSLIAACIIRCCVRRKHRDQQQVQAPLKAKDCDFDVEEERLQNERNMLHMNNKCGVPQKIVNELDRVPAKLAEAPPKVLNKEVINKRIPDKSLMCSSRTLQKKDNTCGSLMSCHSPQDFPPCKSGGIYVIEDHLRTHPDPGPTLKMEDILATEV